MERINKRFKNRIPYKKRKKIDLKWLIFVDEPLNIL